MIQKVTCRYFKSFAQQSFDLQSLTLLAGPNNSGKSTLLQAVMVWNLALKRWVEKKGPESSSKAVERAGTPITRPEFSALPLPAMDQLWTDTQTSLRKNEVAGKAPGTPRPMSITLYGKAPDGKSWKLGFEFRYSGPEQIHVKPVADDLKHLETARKEVSVIYVPPFSGIGVTETRYDRPYQDMLIGQGKGGDILRNLLLEVSEQAGGSAWDELAKIIEDVFQYRLLRPAYGGSPYITCQYLKGVPKGKGNGGHPTLDVSTTGSGFHQVLLILAFLFARPSSLILLDEPDAHLHVLLQKQLYDVIRSLCNKRHGQLVVASHAEVLIDSTSPQQILSFYKNPHQLASHSDRDQVREALKRVTSLELLLSETSGGVLYLEGNTDFDLLKAWAEILDHDLSRWFKTRALWHNNMGRDPKEASAHFFALKAARPEISAILLLDGDNRSMPDRELSADGLTIIRWERYEAESYLLHPESLRRFITGQRGELFAEAALAHLRNEVPPSFFKDPLASSSFLKSEPASKTLIPTMLERAGLDLTKSDFYQIAEQMRPEEIPAEVKLKLDSIHNLVNRK